MPSCSTIHFALLAVAAFAPRLWAMAATQPSPMIPQTSQAISFPASHALFLDDDDDDDRRKPATAPTHSTPAMSGTSRYFFGLLDSRSSYGHDFFHDPFLGPEFDSERQIELDYLHGEKRGLVNDEVDAGFQWNVVGQLMIAGEFGWESQRAALLPGGAVGDDDEPGSFSGLESVDLAIYHPILQFVSADDSVDYTACLRLDFGIPTRTRASTGDLQLTPYLGQLLRIGRHVSIETWTGGAFSIAPHQTDPFVYGVSIGYELFHEQVPLPFTEKLTPIVELDGQTPFSNRGQDAVFGVSGFDFHGRSVGAMDPHLEVGYQFPLDQGARNQLRWGIVAQLFLEF